MDKGTNAKKMLMGNVIGLKLGYVGVKGRSQEDIQNQVTAKEGVRKEKKWFSKHPIYATMNQQYLGTSSLTKKLTVKFYAHIRSYLPKIIREINVRAKDCKEKIKNFGEKLPDKDDEKKQLLWNMVTDFCESFKN